MSGREFGNAGAETGPSTVGVQPMGMPQPGSYAGALDRCADRSTAHRNATESRATAKGRAMGSCKAAVG